MTEQDRRVRRTRKTLHEALISLILEQDYERITVQDILDRADVGRSTFYAHYRDKEALLITSFDDLRDDLRREIEARPPVHAVTVVFEHAHRNHRVYRALCGKQGGNVVHGHLHRLIGGVLREQLQPHLAASGSELPADVVAEFYTSAALGLLVWWVNEDFPYGPGKLAEFYRQLAAPQVSAELAGNDRAGAGH